MWGFFLYILLNMAIACGLAYLGGLLLAPDEPEEEGPIESAQSRSWNPRSTQTEGIPRPRAYGKNMHHGNIVSKWTNLAGRQQLYETTQREVLYLIVEHGDGPTKGVGSNIVFLNDQPLSNFSSVVMKERRGTMDQNVINGFEKEKLEYVMNKELEQGAPYIFTTPNDFFDDIELTLLCPDGLLHYHDDGSMHTGYVHVCIRISVHGADSWTTLFNSIIVGVLHGGRDPIFRLWKISNFGYNISRGTQYDLKIERISGYKDNYVNTVILKSVREVIDVAFERPGKVLVGLRAVATKKLSGSMDVKVIREDRIINVYDGTSWKLKYSRNRAWVVWDVLSQPIITGNGIDVSYAISRYEGIDVEYLDLDFFYTWSQFCEEQIHDGYGGYEDRCACDVIVDDFTDIFTLARDLAAIGRAFIYWKGHLLTGWIDTNVTTPNDLVTMDSIMHKTWKNVWAVKSELAGIVEVLYKDARQGYERTTADFPLPDAGSYKNTVSMEGMGITTRGTAIHYAYYLLERNRLIRNTNTFKVHKDGFRYKIGDVIRLQCKIANWGHAYRVVSASGANGIIVDREVSGDINAGDALHIRSYDSVTEQVVTDTYEVESISSKQIFATENFDVTPVKGNLVAAGPANEIKLRRIIKLEPNQENYFNVTVETYDTDLFLTDDLDPECPNANYVWPGPTLSVPTPLTYQEVKDLVTASIPPTPINVTPVIGNVRWVGEEKLYESHTTGKDSSYTVGKTGVSVSCHQTFTPEEAHTITKVELELFDMQGNGLPGEITVEIFDTSVGFPVGAALCSGVIDASLLKPAHMSDVYSGNNIDMGDVSYGTYISSDGTMLFICIGAYVQKWFLSTPWDITTAIYDSVSLYLQGLHPIFYGLFFAPDGLTMYVVCGYTPGGVCYIYDKTLSSAWDVTDVANEGSAISLGCAPHAQRSLRFSSDGSKLYLLDKTNGYVLQWNMSTPWDTTSRAAEAPSTVKNISAVEDTPKGMCFNSDGTKLYICGNENQTIYRYSLSTPWLISSMSKDAYEIDISETSTVSGDIWYVNDNGAYLVGDADEHIYEFNPAAEHGDFHEFDLGDDINLLIDTTYDIRVTYDSYLAGVNEVEFVYNTDGDDNYEIGELLLDAGSGPHVIDSNDDFNFKEYGRIIK